MYVVEAWEFDNSNVSGLSKIRFKSPQYSDPLEAARGMVDVLESLDEETRARYGRIRVTAVDPEKDASEATALGTPSADNGDG